MDFTSALSDAFADINWLAVVVATVSTFVVGAIFYHEKVLGTKWQAEVGLKKKDIADANMGKTFGLAGLLSLFSAIFLAALIQIGGFETLKDGALFGGVVGIFFVAASMGVNYLYAQRSFNLFSIDAAYMIINFLVMGAIIGSWQ